MEEKNLAEFGQKPLKSRSEREWKATLLLTITLCVSQHKVVNIVFHPENYVETLPPEWTQVWQDFGEATSQASAPWHYGKIFIPGLRRPAF